MQRTAATTPFFLAHRELILGKLFGPSSDAPTLPWALFGDNLTAMPPQWQHSCQPDFIARLCLHCAAPLLAHHHHSVSRSLSTNRLLLSSLGAAEPSVVLQDWWALPNECVPLPARLFSVIGICCN